MVVICLLSPHFYGQQKNMHGHMYTLHSQITHAEYQLHYSASGIALTSNHCDSLHHVFHP